MYGSGGLGICILRIFPWLFCSSENIQQHLLLKHCGKKHRIRIGNKTSMVPVVILMSSEGDRNMQKDGLLQIGMRCERNKQQIVIQN